MNAFPQKNFMTFFLIVLMSFSAGAVGGLFGTGGGILIVYLFSRIYQNSPEVDRRDIFAMTVVTVALISLSSLFSYMKSGAVGTSDILPTVIPALVGGLTGAFLLDRVDLRLLNRIFAILIVYAGATLIFR